MYLPDHFRLTDPVAIRAAMAANPFASFATNGAEGPEISQLPLIAADEAEGTVLYGHFARANAHWKRLDGETPAVAIFSGPHGYISPGWYASKPESGKVVPTWNYVIVEARGIPRKLAPGTETRMAVEMLTDAMERRRPRPWHVADAPASYTAAMLRGIVAFRMPVSALTAKAKLSQNKSDADRAGAAGGLEQEGNSDLAGAMRVAMLD